MEWLGIHFRFFFLPASSLYLSTGWRMQRCSLPIFQPVRCFVINRSVNEILEIIPNETAHVRTPNVLETHATEAEC